MARVTVTLAERPTRTPQSLIGTTSDHPPDDSLVGLMEPN